MIGPMDPVENAGILIEDMVNGGSNMSMTDMYGKTVGGVLLLGALALGAGKFLKNQFVEDVNTQSEKFKNVIRAHNVEVQAHIEKARAEEREVVEDEILVNGAVIGKKQMPDVVEPAQNVEAPAEDKKATNTAASVAAPQTTVQTNTKANNNPKGHNQYTKNNGGNQSKK